MPTIHVCLRDFDSVVIALLQSCASRDEYSIGIWISLQEWAGCPRLGTRRSFRPVRHVFGPRAWPESSIRVGVAHSGRGQDCRMPR
jgi:hypothetical protein